MNIDERVKNEIAHLSFDDRTPENLQDDETLDDLQFDSLDHMELLMNLEEEFGIEIPDQSIQDFKTVKGVIDYIEGRHCDPTEAN